MHIEVCKTFICHVLQIGKQRKDTLQNKITLGKSLADQRGKHFNKPIKIKSFMFHFLEGMFQKGPNSVCSFLHYVLQEIQYSHPLIDNLTELILFSDATCSQNRCWTVLKFCLFIAIKLNIKIVHIFPVRGHSFCICDANFSLLGRKLKKIETVELPKEYIDMLKMQKFDVLQEKIFNYENFLSLYFREN